LTYFIPVNSNEIAPARGPGNRSSSGKCGGAETPSLFYSRQLPLLHNKKRGTDHGFRLFREEIADIPGRQVIPDKGVKPLKA
jgi:hypothetical protein